ncbi:MAG: hypothetical protein ACE5JR_10950 [Gemmatimonadota bacterium]
MNETQAEKLLRLLQEIHGVLQSVEASLEHLGNQLDLQRETLDGVLVNTMELVDLAKR